MPKKKTNNRLDKLFDEINREAETQQAKDPTRIERESSKRTATVEESIIGKSPDSISQINTPAPTNNISALTDMGVSVSTMLSTAFRTDEKNWATLKIVDEAEQRIWGVEEQMLVKQVADQLSLALENARLFQDSQRRAREMTALAEVSREISATLELQTVLERIAFRAQEILNAVTTAVYVPDPEFKMLMAISAIGEEADEIKNDPLVINRGILGRIAYTKVGEIVNDVTNDPRAVTIQGTKNVSDEHLMAAPIMSQDILNGLLVVWRVGVGEEFLKTELEFLESLAQQATIAVENARLFEETQERTQELTVLNEMGRELSAEMNLNSIAETAYRYVNRLIDTANFFIALFDEHTNQISFPFFIEKNERINVPPRKPGKGLTEYVIRSREPVFLPNNIREHAKSIGLEEVLVGNKEIALSWLGVPLLVGNKAVGAMAVQSLDTADLYSEHDKELMMTIASQVAIALENARLLKNAQSRARREKILREITAHIRATNEPEMIAKTAVRELGQALGASTFIRLGSREISSKQKIEEKGAKSKDKKINSIKKRTKPAEGGK